MCCLAGRGAGHDEAMLQNVSLMAGLMETEGNGGTGANHCLNLNFPLVLSFTLSSSP